MSAERLLRLWLRVVAVILLPALACALLPVAWMESVHEALGLGSWSGEPLLIYLARSVSVLYGFFGLTALFVSFDVRRYRPLVEFLALVGIAFGPCVLAIAATAGMPPAWAWSEGPAVAGMCLVMFALARRAKEQEGREWPQESTKWHEKKH